MKRGRLSKKDEQFIIDNSDKGAEFIAKKLQRTVEYIEKRLSSETTEQEKPKKEKKSKNKPFVMTESISQKAELTSKKKAELSDRWKDCVVFIGEN